MKILVLLPDSPEPWSNTAARYYAPMLKTLVELGHDVTALALRRKPDDGDELAYFDGCNVRLHLFNPPTARPFLERKLRSLWRSGWELARSDFGRAARDEAQRDCDVILAEHPATARVLEDDPRIVLSLHCLRHVDIAGGRLRDLGVREQIQARRAELSTCHRVPVIRTVSRRLEQLLRAERVAASIRAIPLCIDADLYPRQPAPPVATVGLLGSMYWPPSRLAARHFVERLVPRIRAQFAGARFLVGGWQARRYLSDVVSDNGVELLDSFPSPAEAFARLSVLVYAPPVGTGMKVKVLEAMAFGVPAVVNGEGLEGFEVDPDPPVRLARCDDEIVDHVVRVLRDPTARRRMAEDGRRCIERSFSPQVVTKALLQLFETRKDSLRARLSAPAASSPSFLNVPGYQGGPQLGKDDVHRL